MEELKNEITRENPNFDIYLKILEKTFQEQVDSTLPEITEDDRKEYQTFLNAIKAKDMRIVYDEELECIMSIQTDDEHYRLFVKTLEEYNELKDDLLLDEVLFPAGE